MIVHTVVYKINPFNGEVRLVYATVTPLLSADLYYPRTSIIRRPLLSADLYYPRTSVSVIIHGFNPKIYSSSVVTKSNNRNSILSVKQQDKRSASILGWSVVPISFSVTLSHSLPRLCTTCRGLVLEFLYAPA